MIRTKRSPGQKQINGINITPFTDVCLVLLIIFMVTAPAMVKEAAQTVVLPPTASGENTPPPSITLTVTKEAALYLNDEVVPLEHLQQRMQQLQNDTQATVLVVRADEQAPYGTVHQALSTARVPGITQLWLNGRLADDTAGR